MAGVHAEERLFESYQLSEHYHSTSCTVGHDDRVAFVCNYTLAVRRRRQQQAAAS